MSETKKSDLFEAALAKILRPVARVMIAFGVPLSTVIKILKTSLVKEAEAHYDIDGKSLTDSRITVLTGVHRKDVKAIRASDQSPVEKTRNGVLGTVIARWLADERFSRSEDAGKSLARLVDDTGGPTFNELVESVASDIRPRTVLDALITQGIVTHEQEGDRVYLNTHAYVPSADDEEQFKFFGNNLHDHMAAAAHNITKSENDDPFLERAVFYSNLTPGSIEAIKGLVRERGMDALLDVNREALKRQKSDSDKDNATARFRFGLFFFSDDERSGP